MSSVVGVQFDFFTAFFASVVPESSPATLQSHDFGQPLVPQLGICAGSPRFRQGWVWDVLSPLQQLAALVHRCCLSGLCCASVFLLQFALHHGEMGTVGRAMSRRDSIKEAGGRPLLSGHVTSEPTLPHLRN